MTMCEDAGQTKSVVLNPDSFIAEAANLRRISTGLIDGVGLFGSTHAQATWRNDVIEHLQGQGIQIFDPQLPPNTWEQKHVAPEAEALTSFSVIVFRLENKNLEDGSLGSIGEIGMAMTSALLRGQKVVISMEEGFWKTLEMNQAKTQLAAVQVWLEKLKEGNIDRLQMHEGNDLKQLSSLLSQQVSEQKTRPIQPYSLKKLSTSHRLFVFGGTMGGYADPSQRVVSAFRDKTMHVLKNNPANTVENLSTNDWRATYHRNRENMNIPEVVRKFQDELDVKMDADTLVWPIIAEGMSMASVAETGMMMFDRLKQGKHMVVLMEAFDPQRFMQETIMRIDDVLDEIIRLEGHDGESSAMLEIQEGNSKLSFKELRKIFERVEILKDEFVKADSANRVRNLARGHLDRLVEYQKQAIEGGRLPEPLFIVADDRADFFDSLKQIAQ